MTFKVRQSTARILGPALQAEETADVSQDQKEGQGGWWEGGTGKEMGQGGWGGPWRAWAVLRSDDF